MLIKARLKIQRFIAAMWLEQANPLNCGLRVATGIREGDAPSSPHPFGPFNRPQACCRTGFRFYSELL